MIYIFGDSHSSIFIQNDICKSNKLLTKDNFSSYRTAPFVAYNLINKINEISSIIKQFPIKDSDYLFFAYGEVDIRCHLGFISDNSNTNIDEVVNTCVNRYIDFLLYFKKIYKNVGAYSPIASGMHNGKQGNGRASYKSPIERNKITSIFTNLLRDKCRENNLLFKTIFPILCDEKYITNNYYYSVDGVHLGENATELLHNEFADLTM